MASIKVLSIDGGGIRGIIPAVILDEIQKRLGKNVCEVFDLIAGTSTGGIIALGIGTAAHNGRPYSPGVGALVREAMRKKWFGNKAIAARLAQESFREGAKGPGRLAG